MAPDGLKVGDKFLEGNMVYEVTKVVDNGIYRYESKWTGEFSSTAPVVKQPETTESNYAELQYAQLKKLCAERGLNAVGSKADLVARLEG